MDSKEIEYKFKIDAYSPETIPMVRLGEYMAEFGKLLSNASSVHFRKIEKGSTVLTAGVEFEAEPKIRRRLQATKNAEDKDGVEVAARLNKMLRDDNANGLILAAKNGQITEEFYLAGREIPAPKEIGPFNEPATIKAMLFRIGGRDETAHAQLLDSAGRTWNGKLTQEQAAHMAAAGLYQWFIVNGMARWVRTEEDTWELKDFRISDFSLLPKHSLQQEIEALRKIEGSEWGGTDPSEFIEKIRRDDEIH